MASPNKSVQGCTAKGRRPTLPGDNRGEGRRRHALACIGWESALQFAQHSATGSALTHACTVPAQAAYSSSVWAVSGPTFFELAGARPVLLNHAHALLS